MALVWAASNGHAECVKLLASANASPEDASDALGRAAMYGHADCIESLIPVCDPKARNSQALRYCAQNGHAECVRLLLPHSDPQAVGPEGLGAAAAAVDAGHPDIATLIGYLLATQEGHALLAELAEPPKASSRSSKMRL